MRLLKCFDTFPSFPSSLFETLDAPVGICTPVYLSFMPIPDPGVPICSQGLIEAHTKSAPPL